jgi:biotin carboxyl carrier protein
MAKRRWTVMLIPHGTERSRILEVTNSWLRTGAIGIAVILGLAALTGYALAYRSARAGFDEGLLTRRNRMADELGRLNARLGALTDTINTISRHDARIRVLANLDPLKPEVHAAGIGGPAAPRPSWVDSDPLSEHADQVRVDINALVRRADLLSRSFSEAADSLASHRDRLVATPSIMPTQGWLTSAFQSMREHPILHVARPHEGIDVSTPMGTPIEAPAAGTVVFSGRETGYGSVIIIDHGFGIRTKYAHCSKLIVGVGAKVTRGQQIALVGNTGLSTGPHLHYEVLVNGQPVDPLRYVLSDRAIVD